MTDPEFLLLLQYALLGSQSLILIASFLRSGGSAQELMSMGEEEFQFRFQGSREKILLEGRHVADPAAELSLAEKCSIRVLTLMDEDYPAALRQIFTPPLAIYVKGEFSPAEELCLAIVGTRRPSYYGVETAIRFAKELASAGLVIVSGLAQGVDTCAHDGALQAEGKTYAVMGSGLLEPYPAQNRPLMQKIERMGGVLISELPLRAKPLAFHFPLRNRIISGLSRGVCVVEAAESSGSLITARLALEEGREIYAIPGMVQSLTSQGTLKLIQEGAKLVRKPEDILEDYLPWLQFAAQDLAGPVG